MKQPGARSLRRWVSLVFIALSLVLYGSLAPFGYVLLGVASVLPLSWATRARLLQTIVRTAFRGFHHYLRWIRFLDFVPRDLCPPTIGSCVLVANHPSMTDALAVLASVPDTCTAVREDVYQTPWLKPLLRGAGHFSAGADNPLGGSILVQASVDRLKRGFRVLLFPEGTRSPRSGGLQRFGRSAFEAACRADVPVVALLIREAPPWLAKGDRITTPKERMSVKTVQLLKVAHPRDFFGDSRVLRDYVESAYQHALGEPNAQETLRSGEIMPHTELKNLSCGVVSTSHTPAANQITAPLAKKAIGE